MALQIHQVERRTKMEGFDFPGFFGKLAAESEMPRTKAELIALLVEEGDKYAGWLEKATEELLSERVGFPSHMMPPDKSRFEMLLSVKEHEMHHRAQLMVMQRMIGLEPHMTREMNARIAEMLASRATAS